MPEEPYGDCIGLFGEEIMALNGGRLPTTTAIILLSWNEQVRADHLHIEVSTMPQTANAPGSENVLVPVISTALTMAAAMIVNPIMNTRAMPIFCFMLILATHMIRRGRDITRRRD